MPTIKFVVTENMNELTWEDWNSLEEGASKHTREIMARFLVDENDKPVEYKEAMKILGAVKMKELAEVTGGFWRSLRDASVNPQTGGQ